MTIDTQRLRELISAATTSRYHSVESNGNIVFAYGIQPEALQELTTVATENLPSLLDRIDAQTAEIEALRIQVDGYDGSIAKRDLEIDRLRDALEVFAKAADELDGSPEDGVPCVPDDEWAKFRFLASDYRKARAALSGEGKC